MIAEAALWSAAATGAISLLWLFSEVCHKHDTKAPPQPEHELGDRLQAPLLEQRNTPYRIPSKVPLATRQLFLWVALCWHFVATAWAATRHGKWLTDLVQGVAWCVIYAADAYRPTLKVSPMLPLVALVSAWTSYANQTNIAIIAIEVFIALIGIAFRRHDGIPSHVPPTAEDKCVGLVELSFFTFLTPVLRYGSSRGRLEVDDLPATPGEDETVTQWRKFDTSRRRRLWRRLLALVWRQAAALGFVAVLSVASNYLRIYALNVFLRQLQEGRRNASATWFAVGCLFACPIVTACAQSITSGLQTRISARCRSVLVVLVFDKALRCDLGSAGATVGEIVNLMSADVDSIVWVAAYSDELWLPMFQATACLGFVFAIVGTAGLAAASCMLLMAIANNRGFKYIYSQQTELIKVRDERLRMLSEALQNIRLVKLCAMEPDVKDAVDIVRTQELRLILKFLLGIAALISFITAAPKLAAVSTFLIYALALGNKITPAKGFTLLELLSDLETTFVALPNAIDAFTRAVTALDKLETFLDCREVDIVPKQPGAPTAISLNGSFEWTKSQGSLAAAAGAKPPTPPPPPPPCTDQQLCSNSKLFFCVPRNAAAKQASRVPSPPQRDTDVENPLLEGENSDADCATLRDVQLMVPAGSLVVIGGETASGKSSLLLASLGELASKGEAHRELGVGSVALVPQKAWCQHATLRNNVCAFGARFDPVRYRKVLKSCALEPDLELLDKGDMTMIGSRGINLSGGQQARVNLARAVYSDADLVLMDDPLAAVDAKVAKHLFNRAILGDMMHRKTRVLVTHHLDIAARRADYLIFLDKGTIVEHGTPSALKDSPLLARALAGSSGEALENPSSLDETDDAAENETGRESMITTTTVATETTATTNAPQKHDNDDDDDEYRDRGAVKWAAYAFYFMAVGSWGWLLAVFLLLILTQVANFLQSYFMARWIGSMEHGDDPESPKMYAYTAASAVYVMAFAGGFALRSFAQIRASRTLHRIVIDKVLGATVAFLDKTPCGRILNRFSSDIQAVDRTLPPALFFFLFCLCNPISTLAAMLATAPILSALLPLIIVYDAIVARTYITAARECKRLASLNKSPIYDYFAETLNGLAVVRAFDGQRPCLDRLAAMVDRSVRCDKAQAYAFRWLGVRLESFGGVLGGLTAAILATALRSTVSPALAGFVLQYASAMAFYVKYIVECYANLEIAMNSQERLYEYANLEQEPSLRVADTSIVDVQEPPPEWPSTGAVVADRLFVRYPGSPNPVLNDLSFSLPGETKTGVVGRTGKSIICFFAQQPAAQVLESQRLRSPYYAWSQPKAARSK